MTSTYFASAELTEVKSELSITGSSLDTTLNNFSDDVEGIMHDRMYSIAAKHRRITQLPVLPLKTAHITNSIKQAMKSGVCAKYYEKEQSDLDKSKYFWEQMDKVIDGWVLRQKSEAQIFGRVIS